MMSNKMHKVLSEILSSDVKVVSFDMFDTLVLRSCDPLVLRSIEAKHHDMALDKLLEYRNAQFSWWNKDSYPSQIKNNLEYYRQYELDLEKSSLMPHKTVIELFNELKKAGLELIITTDMYLPVSFLKEVLAKNDISGYANIYLSCELNKSKHDEQLYKLIIEDYKGKGIAPSQIVHIGDNYSDDYVKAKKNGLQAYHFPSPRQLLSKSDLGHLFVPVSIGDELLCGLIACRLFDDPFKEYVAYTNGESLTIANLLSAFFIGYTTWMVEDAKYRDIDQLLLIMSDGYLIEKILNQYKKKVEIPDYCRFYLSRLVRSSKILLDKGVSNDPKMRYYLDKSFFNKNIDVDYLETLLFKINHSLKLSPFELEDLNAALDKPLLEKHSKEMDKYISSIIRNHKKPALFDGGYKATALEFCNRYCSAIPEDTIEYQLVGAPLGCRVLNYIENRIHQKTETIISLDLCVKSFEKKVKSIEVMEELGSDKYLYDYAGDDRPSISSAYIQLVVENFAEQFFDMFSNYLSYIQCSHYCFWNAILAICNSANQNDKSVITAYNNWTVTKNTINSAITLFIDAYNKTLNGEYAGLIGKILLTYPEIKLEKPEYWLKIAISQGIDWARTDYYDLVKENIDLEQSRKIIAPLISKNNKKALERLYQSYPINSITYKEARLNYLRIASFSDSKANCEIVDYLLSQKDPISDKEAFERCRRYCRIGDVGAMGRMGRIFRGGRYVTRNLSQAAIWMRKAADSSPSWNNELVDILLMINTMESNKEAYDRCMILASKGDTGAMGRIGRMYYCGQHVTKNQKIALEWLTKAAQGNPQWLKELEKMSQPSSSE